MAGKALGLDFGTTNSVVALASDEGSADLVDFRASLVLKGGRDTFEQGLSDDILVASAGAHFTQRLMHRIALVLRSVLERS